MSGWLTSITIENFKAYGKSQVIPIKPLTLIFGQNSAGKSSIFHALAFLKWCHTTGGNCNPDKVELGWESVSLGGWQNLIFGHNPTKEMRLGVGYGSSDITWSFKYQGPEFAASVCEMREDTEPSGIFVNTGGTHPKWRGTFNRDGVVGMSLRSLKLVATG